MTGKPRIAVLGGTGELGSALARRWSAAGYPVLIGSRDAEKASAAASPLGGTAAGATNLAAAEAADIVVIAVPFSSHLATLAEVRDAVQGKVVVDAVVPLVPPKVGLVQLPPEGSAAQIAQQLLGDGVRVTAAFHNVGAKKLSQSGTVDCDVLVFGDDKPAKEIVIALANAAGTRGLDGGPLANASAAEALTSVLIGINRRYKVDGAGIRITGLGTL
jgi:NADPH-dependent F420 reductase